MKKSAGVYTFVFVLGLSVALFFGLFGANMAKASVDTDQEFSVNFKFKNQASEECNNTLSYSFCDDLDNCDLFSFDFQLNTYRPQIGSEFCTIENPEDPEQDWICESITETKTYFHFQNFENENIYEEYEFFPVLDFSQNFTMYHNAGIYQFYVDGELFGEWENTQEHILEKDYSLCTEFDYIQESSGFVLNYVEQTQEENNESINNAVALVTIGSTMWIFSRLIMFMLSGF
jgi:hypothetical protein